MSRIGERTRLLLGLGAVVALAGTGTILAGGEVEQRGKLRWVFHDHDGTRHEETIEFDGARPFLGVGLERGPDGGARIDSIVEGSAAESAGLQVGDVVVGFDGETIESPWGLMRAVLEAEVGDRVDVEIERDGRSRTLGVELGEHEGWAGAFAFGDGDFNFDFDLFDSEAFREQIEKLENMEFDFERLEGRMEKLHERLGNMSFNFDLGDLGDLGHRDFALRMGKPRLGVSLVGVTGDLREHLGAERDEGVLVGRVLEDTPAEDAGVEVGDLIVAVDGEKVGSR
ncbi:MAG: PDZ domain-containing protein, partial [Acidobacteria bacterium]|nr:PDZ domain-containing protein [Acidobacteriota bacterium]NIO60872.1 PDZ domain-containing protein [Acidobacteriota bacterium]NIQ29867.1 PDZ domain-containing protein [Acidobacteriota bacterium]NIQ87333.1 PDZ domain-containing protein [Acidobacteriota bacterium]